MKYLERVNYYSRWIVHWKIPKSTMDNSALTQKWKILNFFSVTLCFCLILNVFASQFSCDKSREVFTKVTYGRISHGNSFNYTQVSNRSFCVEFSVLVSKFIRFQDSHCEWLIQADNDSQFISLKFSSFKTECSYDYVSCLIAQLNCEIWHILSHISAFYLRRTLLFKCQIIRKF